MPIPHLLRRVLAHCLTPMISKSISSTLLRKCYPAKMGSNQVLGLNLTNSHLAEHWHRFSGFCATLRNLHFGIETLVDLSGQLRDPARLVQVKRAVLHADHHVREEVPQISRGLNSLVPVACGHFVCPCLASHIHLSAASSMHVRLTDT